MIRKRYMMSRELQQLDLIDTSPNRQTPLTLSL